MQRRRGIRHERSSGNVFADVGLPENYLAKAEMVATIDRIISQRQLTQAQAAKVLGIDQPRVSSLLGGKLNLFSLERLMELLERLGNSIEVRISPSPKPSLRIVSTLGPAEPSPFTQELYRYIGASTFFAAWGTTGVTYVTYEGVSVDNILDQTVGSFDAIDYSRVHVAGLLSQNTFEETLHA